MQERSTNRFAYATLIDTEHDPADPEVLLEIGMERPVDWDAVDDDGAVICKRLDFVLTVDYVKIAGEPIGIHFVYERVVKDHGLHGDLHVYVLGLRPSRVRDGRDSDSDLDALDTAVGEARHVRRRSWCADIGEIRVNWRHAPQDVISLPNGAFVPEETPTELPPATEEEIERARSGFDSWCDEIESSPGITVSETKQAEGETSSPGILLEDDDIEFMLDGTLVEISTPQDSVPIRMPEKSLALG
jgi:hypothetical protein